MTQDEIIEMARKAGASVYNGGPHFSWKEAEAFAKLVAAKERDRIIGLLKGIDETEIENTEFGWWETSTGADFGEAILRQIKGEE